MLISKEEAERKVKIIHHAKEVIYGIENSKPISCYKLIGSVFISYGRITNIQLVQLTNVYKDLPLVKKLVEQRDFLKAIVADDSYVVLFFIDNSAVMFENEKFVKAIHDMFMII